MLKGIAKVFVSVLLAFTPVLANAIVITLDPDDFAAGAPLQNDYVKVLSTDGLSWNEPTILRGQGGPSSFGVFALTYPTVGEPHGWGGLLLQFNQEVSRVKLVTSTHFEDEWSRILGWVAFDRDGMLIKSGGADVPFGRDFEVDIQLKGVWSMILGGAESRHSIHFDDLSFEIDDKPNASVPAPNPLVLLMMGLAMITLRAKFRMHSK